MNAPNAVLLKHYGTTRVFEEKTAGGSPFAARVAAALLSGHMVHDAQLQMDHQRMEAHQMNEQFRLIEQRELAPAEQNLQHTPAPIFIPANSNIPAGWDEGMVRLASVSRTVGRQMAKIAFSPGSGSFLMGGQKLPAPPKLPSFGPPQSVKSTFVPTHTAPAVRPSQVGQTMPAPASHPMAMARTMPSPAMPKVAGMGGNLMASAQGALKGFGQRAGGMVQGLKGRLAAAPAAAQAAVSKAAPALIGEPKKTPLMDNILGKNWLLKGTLAGGALLGGYGALKGVNAGLGWMSRESSPQSWGVGQAPPMGVNQYGQPQSGTSLM